MTIISILAAMLLPTLGKAQQKAQGIQCLSNLRQLGLAWIMYSDDHRDQLPPNPNAYQTNVNRAWVAGAMDTTGWSDNTNTYFLTHSLVGRYVNSVGVWKCPGDKSTSLHGGQVLPRVRSVSMNAYLNVTEDTGAGWADGPYQVFQKLSAMVRPPPGRIWVMIDERGDGINQGLFALQSFGLDPVDPATTTFFNAPAFYHQRGGSLNFADGHSETRKWLDQRTTSARPPDSRNGTDSPRNIDLVWMLERSTTRK